MAFSETQDEEESVATFPLQTVDGDQLEVGKHGMRGTVLDAILADLLGVNLLFELQSFQGF